MNTIFRRTLLIALPCLSFVTLIAWPSVAATMDSGDAASAPKPNFISFSADVAPLLQEHCVACHGAKKAEGGYRVDSFERLQIAGDSGSEPISTVEGVPHELLRRLTTDDAHERMPAEAESLDAAAIQMFSSWLDQGAKFDGENPAADLLSIIPAKNYPNPPASYPAVPVTALTFSPDGNSVVSGGYHELLVWDASAPTNPRRISNIGQRVFAFDWLQDGNSLVVACGSPGRNGEVRLIDFQSGQVIAVSDRLSDTILDLSVQPVNSGDQQEPLIAVACADGTVRMLNSKTLKQQSMFASHADLVTAVAWAHDGKSLASCSKDKSVKVYDIESKQLRVNFQGHSAAVRGVAFTVDGAHVVSVGADNKMLRWKAENGEKVAEVGLPAESFKLHPVGETVISGCNNKTMIRIDLSNNSPTNNKISQTFAGHNDWVIAAAVESTHSRLASGTIDGEIFVWNSEDGNVLQQWKCQP